ncbi:MAG TPA: hypothetical protein VF268_06925, partial [Gammaproteobacteria bacterium]
MTEAFLHSSLDNPKNFLLALHPLGIRGDIILEKHYSRHLKKKSRISPSQLIASASEVWGQPNYFVSVCTFNQFPFICHFKQTNMLWVSIPITKKISTKEIDEIKTKISWELNSVKAVTGCPIPLWSFALFDGESLSFFWILEKPICSTDFYKWFQCQKTLYSLLRGKFKLNQTSLDPTQSIRVIGSLNPAIPYFVRLEENRSRIFNFSELKSPLLKLSGKLLSDDICEHHDWNIRFNWLIAVLENRFWIPNRCPKQSKYWFLFLALSISFFCPVYCLERELKVIAELIEGKKWPLIESKYSPLIMEFKRNVMPALDCFSW